MLKERMLLSLNEWIAEEAKKRKMIVMLECDDNTSTRLREYCLHYGFDLTTKYDGTKIDIGEFDFHLTLVCSKNAVLFDDVEKRDECIVPAPVGFEVLGVDRKIPVIKLQDPGLLNEIRQFHIEEFQLEPTFDEFKPHISLSYNWEGKPAFDDIELPDFNLRFDRLKVQEAADI